MLSPSVCRPRDVIDHGGEVIFIELVEASASPATIL
jgi:hypothetical protein